MNKNTEIEHLKKVAGNMNLLYINLPSIIGYNKGLLKGTECIDANTEEGERFKEGAIKAIEYNIKELEKLSELLEVTDPQYLTS